MTAVPLDAADAWLLDLDGTLVDSSPAHEEAFLTALRDVEPGLVAGFDYAAHRGATTRSVAVALLGEGERAERLARRKQQAYRAAVALGRVRRLPGADDLLRHLASRGCPTYLVTSGSRASVDGVLSACDWHDLFRGTLTADDVPAGKPSPQVYREAGRRWALDRHRTVVVEDSPHGVAAAVGAGLTTVQVHAATPAPGAVPVRDLVELVGLLGAPGPLVERSEVGR